MASSFPIKRLECYVLKSQESSNFIIAIFILYFYLLINKSTICCTICLILYYSAGMIFKRPDNIPTSFSCNYYWSIKLIIDTGISSLVSTLSVYRTWLSILSSLTPFGKSYPFAYRCSDLHQDKSPLELDISQNSISNHFTFFQ